MAEPRNTANGSVRSADKIEGMSGALAGIDKTQFDLAWSGGVSYKLPF